MNRRDLLKTSVAAGLSLAVPFIDKATEKPESAGLIIKPYEEPREKKLTILHVFDDDYIAIWCQTLRIMQYVDYKKYKLNPCAMKMPVFLDAPVASIEYMHPIYGTKHTRLFEVETYQFIREGEKVRIRGVYLWNNDSWHLYDPEYYKNPLKFVTDFKEKIKRLA